VILRAREVFSRFFFRRIWIFPVLILVGSCLRVIYILPFLFPPPPSFRLPYCHLQVFLTGSPSLLSRASPKLPAHGLFLNAPPLSPRLLEHTFDVPTFMRSAPPFTQCKRLPTEVQNRPGFLPWCCTDWYKLIFSYFARLYKSWIRGAPGPPFLSGHMTLCIPPPFPLPIAAHLKRSSMVPSRLHFPGITSACRSRSPSFFLIPR